MLPALPFATSVQRHSSIALFSSPNLLRLLSLLPLSLLLLLLLFQPTRSIALLSSLNLFLLFFLPLSLLPLLLLSPLLLFLLHRLLSLSLRPPQPNLAPVSCRLRFYCARKPWPCTPSRHFFGPSLRSPLHQRSSAVDASCASSRHFSRFNCAQAQLLR